MTALQIGGIAAGGVLVIAGFVAFAFRRFSVRRTPTRLVLGMSMLLLGWHLIMWSLPAKWTLLSVPADRWWMLVVGLVLAVAGTMAADVLESRDDGSLGSPN